MSSNKTNEMNDDFALLTRRRFLELTGWFGALAIVRSILPSYALGAELLPRSKDRHFSSPITLEISDDRIKVGKRITSATTINGTVPGPLVQLHEGETATIHVRNKLDEDSSIHWHGLILPPEMDGVPGVSFAGIKPGETFRYTFPVKQSGTYWYHSHSGLQEQTGVFGPLIITPKDNEPFEYERDYVVILSDWTFEDPHEILVNLKKQSDYYNFQKRTIGTFFEDVSSKGIKSAVMDRMMWGSMRMDPTDISDITGYAYTYLVNGLPPSTNWTGLFRPGEKIRLRFINAAAASYFDVRIPGLKMTVVQADGQNIQPIAVDEFRIAIAETYDVIVQPETSMAYTIFAEAMDRSGFAQGTLAPRYGMTAPIPERRPRPLLGMVDMGMLEMKHSEMKGMSTREKPFEHMTHKMSSKRDQEVSGAPVKHDNNTHGAGNSSVAMITKSRLEEPGIGLEDAKHKVLLYSDLRSLARPYDDRPPGREIELHLTGNMERYMWSFDGKKYSEVKQPIVFHHGERLRLTLVNDTMMNHPIHLHGMWMELVNGAGRFKPKKHTVNVKPAERLSVDITADAPGKWAFHCHILYHMEMGMFRVVSVVGDKDKAT